MHIYVCIYILYGNKLVWLETIKLRVSAKKRERERERGNSMSRIDDMKPCFFFHLFRKRVTMSQKREIVYGIIRRIYIYIYIYAYDLTD